MLTCIAVYNSGKKLNIMTVRYTFLHEYFLDIKLLRADKALHVRRNNKTFILVVFSRRDYKIIMTVNILLSLTLAAQASKAHWSNLHHQSSHCCIYLPIKCTFQLSETIFIYKSKIQVLGQAFELSSPPQNQANYFARN